MSASLPLYPTPFSQLQHNLSARLTRALSRLEHSLPSYRPKFGIRTILAVTAVTAVAVASSQPFEPNVTFSSPVLVSKFDREGASGFDEYSITLTNESTFPIWCRVYEDVVLGTESLQVGGIENFKFDMPSVTTYKRLGKGEAIDIKSNPSPDWERFQVKVKVFDWRSRMYNASSEPMMPQ